MGVDLGVGGEMLSAFRFSLSSNPLLSESSNFSRSLAFFGNFMKLAKPQGGPYSLVGDWLRISCQVVRKVVLYIVCFAYSLLSLLLSLLL